MVEFEPESELGRHFQKAVELIAPVPHYIKQHELMVMTYLYVPR